MTKESDFSSGVKASPSITGEELDSLRFSAEMTLKAMPTLTTQALTVKAVDRVYALQDEVAALRQRLARIINECHNETSGAEEDKGRDTTLAEIIRIAEGERT